MNSSGLGKMISGNHRSRWFSRVLAKAPRASVPVICFTDLTPTSNSPYGRRGNNEMRCSRCGRIIPKHPGYCLYCNDLPTECSDDDLETLFECEEE